MLLLRVEGLNKSFGGLTAVDNLSFGVAPGEILGLIGPNGAGKTTVFNLITGIIPTDMGAVYFEEAQISNIKPYQIASMGLARTFQGTQIFGELTVEQNLSIAQHPRTRVGLLNVLLNTRSAKSERLETNRQVEGVLRLLGMESARDKQAKKLPFMQQCLLGIGMAMASEPRLLLLDEPLAGMNMEETEEMLNLIRDLRQQGLTIILIEHNMQAVMGLCDRLVVLDHGQKIADGNPAEIQDNPLVIEAYLGSEDVEDWEFLPKNRLAKGGDQC